VCDWFDPERFVLAQDGDDSGGCEVLTSVARQYHPFNYQIHW